MNLLVIFIIHQSQFNTLMVVNGLSLNIFNFRPRVDEVPPHRFFFVTVFVLFLVLHGSCIAFPPTQKSQKEIVLVYIKQNKITNNFFIF